MPVVDPRTCFNLPGKRRRRNGRMEGRRSEEVFADQRDVEDPDITIGQDGETLLIRRDAGVGDHATNIEAG